MKKLHRCISIYGWLVISRVHNYVYLCLILSTSVENKCIGAFSASCPAYLSNNMGAWVLRITLVNLPFPPLLRLLLLFLPFDLFLLGYFFPFLPRRWHTFHRLFLFPYRIRHQFIVKNFEFVRPVGMALFFFECFFWILGADSVTLLQRVIGEPVTALACISYDESANSRYALCKPFFLLIDAFLLSKPSFSALNDQSLFSSCLLFHPSAK